MQKLFIATLLAACAVPAVAGNAYVGAGVGRAEQRLNGLGVDLSDHSTSVKLFAGYQFNPTLGAELGLVDFGKATVSGGGASISSEPTSLYVAATGTWPVSSQFALYGKLGLARTHTRFTASMGGMTDSDSTTHTTTMFGAGLTYALNTNVSLFAEYENFGKVVNQDGICLKVDHVAIGARYQF